MNLKPILLLRSIHPEDENENIGIDVKAIRLDLLGSILFNEQDFIEAVAEHRFVFP
jgi:hypothetical protein